MSWKPRTVVERDAGGVLTTSKLVGLLRQTDLNQSDDKGDVALFDFLDTALDVMKRLKEGVDNSIKKDEDVDLITQVIGVLPPANGGSYSQVYTPTLTNTTNITSSTPSILAYSRVGNLVTVTGRVNVTTTSFGNTVLGISLPILSYFLNDFECGGVAGAQTLAGEVGGISGDTTNFRATLRWQTAGAATFDMFFTFTYQLIAKT